jgi:hypothetical protein
MTPSLRSVVTAAQLGLLSGLLLLGAILSLRRVAGGPSVPLAPWMLAATAAAFAASCLLARVLGQPLRDSTAAAWVQPTARFAPLVACALLVAGVLLPGTSLVGGCLLVGLLAVEETWCLAREGVGCEISGPETRAAQGTARAAQI